MQCIKYEPDFVKYYDRNFDFLKVTSIHYYHKLTYGENACRYLFFRRLCSGLLPVVQLQYTSDMGLIYHRLCS
jgi:hypothetical protein